LLDERSAQRAHLMREAMRGLQRVSGECRWHSRGLDERSAQLMREAIRVRQLM